MFCDENISFFTEDNEISFIKNLGEVKVGSSVFLPDIARFYKDKNLINAEFLIGIPGSVGGAVKMNAGAYGWEFSDILSSIEVYKLVTKKIETLDKDDISNVSLSHTSVSDLVTTEVLVIWKIKLLFLRH